MPNYVSIRDISHDKVPVGTLQLAGWIRTHRQSKRVSFIELYDGTCVTNLQLVVDPQLAGYAELAPKLATGASIKVSGELVLSPAKGQKYEFQVKELELLWHEKEMYKSGLTLVKLTGMAMHWGVYKPLAGSA